MTPLCSWLSMGGGSKMSTGNPVVMEAGKAEPGFTMKTKLHSLFIVLALLAGINQAAAQGARFFRISGPAATTIISFNPDGTMVWSNALAGTNYTIQTVSSLNGGSNWADYVQLP